MDQLAANHVKSRQASAERRRTGALDDIESWLKQARNGTPSGWHNLAAIVAMGAQAAGEVEAYDTALAADEASTSNPRPGTPSS